MSEQDPVRIFVVHAFDAHEDYARVFEYLECRDNFFYLNCSDPQGGGDRSTEALQEAIRNQIQHAEAVVFPIGIYSQNAQLIDFELTVAQAFKKPVIAIKSYGDTLAMPVKVMEIAAETVEWNERAITDAIRRHGRGEEIGQWDVIDFDPD